MKKKIPTHHNSTDYDWVKNFRGGQFFDNMFPVVIETCNGESRSPGGGKIEKRKKENS